MKHLKYFGGSKKTPSTSKLTQLSLFLFFFQKTFYCWFWLWKMYLSIYLDFDATSDILVKLFFLSSWLYKAYCRYTHTRACVCVLLLFYGWGWGPLTAIIFFFFHIVSSPYLVLVTPETGRLLVVLVYFLFSIINRAEVPIFR